VLDAFPNFLSKYSAIQCNTVFDTILSYHSNFSLDNISQTLLPNSNVRKLVYFPLAGESPPACLTRKQDCTVLGS